MLKFDQLIEVLSSLVILSVNTTIKDEDKPSASG
jgi:hypothetical protein